MLAILSDIHGNIEALEAVLADIDRRPIDEIYCLGDIIGYGPNPAECVSHSRNFQLCLKGNWDQLVSMPNPEIELKHEHLRIQHGWSRTQLSVEQLTFLSELKTHHNQNGMTFAHGSPRDYVNEYVFPEVVYECSLLDELFAGFDEMFICGHTHIPGVIQQYEFLEPTTIDFRFVPNKKPAIINVGSVGQSRDGDPRACYTIFDGSSFEFIRIEFDWDLTKRKIDDLNWPS